MKSPPPSPLFFTTWPIPRGTPGVYGTVGTQGMCTAQAFFAQFSLSSIMYNVSLLVYFVLVIVKKWSNDRILKVKPFIHMPSLLQSPATTPQQCIVILLLIAPIIQDDHSPPIIILSAASLCWHHLDMSFHEHDRDDHCPSSYGAA